MTVSEKHINAARSLNSLAQECLILDKPSNEAVHAIAAALAAAEREGMRRAAEMVQALPTCELISVSPSGGVTPKMAFGIGADAQREASFKAILSQANTHSVAPPPPGATEAGSVQPSADPAIPFQAKASEDNGATVLQYEMREAADSMTGEVSRVDAGRTASATSEDGRDGPERRAPHHHASRNGEW